MGKMVGTNIGQNRRFGTVIPAQAFPRTGFMRNTSGNELFTVSMHTQDTLSGYGEVVSIPTPHDVPTQKEHSMTDTNEAVITEALAVIDKALAEMLRRELVSSGEVADLLLDVRTLLTHPAPVAAVSAS